MFDLVAIFRSPKNEPIWRSVLAAMSVAVLVVLADQASKAVFYVPGVDHLNTGVSLRFGAFLPTSVLILALSVFLLVMMWLLREFWLKHPVAAGLFLGGSLGNVLDRIWWGGVRDWLAVPLFGVKNNLADWAICLAVLWLIISLCSPSKSFTKTKTSPSSINPPV